MQANSVALIASITPRDRLGRMVGLQAAAQAIGLAAGPAVGGLLLSTASWRLIFLVNVPAGIVGLATAATLLPRSRDLAPVRHIDLRGVALFVPVVGAALLASSLAAESVGWAVVGATAAVAVGLGAAMVCHQRRTTGPLVTRAVLSAIAIRRGLVAAFCGYAVLFGTLVVIPIFLTHRSDTPGTVGLLLAALPGRHWDRRAGSGSCRRSGAERCGRMVWRSRWLVCRCWPCRNRPESGSRCCWASSGWVSAPSPPRTTAQLMLAAPPGSSGAVAGLLNMTRGMGTAAGTAVAVLMFTAAGGLTASMLAFVAVGVVGLLVE